MSDPESKPAVAETGISKVMIIALVVSLLTASAAAGGVYFFIVSQGNPAAGDDAGAEPRRPSGPPIYFNLDPPFVVNLEGSGSVRFLQASIEVMSRDDKVIAAVRRHQPMVRNSLLMLLSSASLEDIATREGKEELRAQALIEVRQVLESEAEPSDVEELYFTGFVVQ
jgi:flagellar protein FliL